MAIPHPCCARTATVGGERARFLAVVPNPEARFPRARDGELGLEEGWALARRVREAVAEDHDDDRRALVAVVDVPGQPYGYREELLGLHLALAAAVDAYATARLAGHPVVALVVGQAISGAFLAHGMQANRILALDDPGVAVQVMSKRSTARVTRRRVEELDEIAKEVPATAYDVVSFSRLGALHRLIDGVDAADRTRRMSRRCAARSPKRSSRPATTALPTCRVGSLPQRPANTETRACGSGSGSPRSGAGEAARHAASDWWRRAALRGIRPRLGAHVACPGGLGRGAPGTWAGWPHPRRGAREHPRANGSPPCSRRTPSRRALPQRTSSRSGSGTTCPARAG